MPPILLPGLRAHGLTAGRRVLTQADLSLPRTAGGSRPAVHRLCSSIHRLLMTRLMLLALLAWTMVLAGCGGGTDDALVTTDGEIRFSVQWADSTDGPPSATQSLAVQVVREGETLAQRLFLPPPERGLTEYRMEGIPRNITATVVIEAKPSADGTGTSLAVAQVQVAVPAQGHETFQATLINEVRSVDVSPATLDLRVGQSGALVATARNARNEVVLVDAASWEWLGANMHISLNADGALATAEALTEGSATLTARDRESGRTSVGVQITATPHEDTAPLSAWSKFRGTTLNTGRGIGAGAAGTLKWAYQTAGDIGSSAAVGADGTLFFGSWDKHLYAVNAADGSLKWKFQTENIVLSSPAIGSNGTVYVGSWDHHLYALDEATGALKWRYKTDGQVYSSPAIAADGTVYVGSADRHLHAIDGATGTLKWKYLTGDIVNSSPAIGIDGTVYVGSYDHHLYAINGDTGSLKWTYRTGNAVASSPAIGADGTVYVGSRNSRLYAIHAGDGSTRWIYRTGGGVLSSPAIGADGTVYVGSNDRQLFAVDGATGELKWKFLTEHRIYSSPAIGGDGTVYVGSEDQHLYAVNGATGALVWKYLTGLNILSSPAIGDDGTVYIGSNSRLHALH